MSYKINTSVLSNSVVASYEKRLSICLESNGFSFSVCSTANELLAFGDVECNLHASLSELMLSVKGALSEAGIQTFGLKESELIVYARQFTWIPQHLYDSAQQRAYLEALCKIEPDHDILSSFNETAKAYMVFCAPNSIVSAFKIAIPGLKVRCQHDKMVNQTLSEASDFKSVLAVNVREKESDFTVLCNKKLQFSNSFECANIDETIYHALNVTKQFRLEDAPMTTAICGNVDRESFARFCKFLPNVALYNGSEMTLKEPEMQHIPLYRYALLFQ